MNNGLRGFPRKPVGTRPVGALFDGGGSALSGGEIVYVPITFRGHIVHYHGTVDTGSCTFNVLRGRESFPTSADQIHPDGGQPRISGSSFLATSLPGWSTWIEPGDVLAIEVDTPSSCTFASIVLEFEVE